MPVERHVTDPLVDELTFLYERGAMRIDALVTAGLRRGLDPRRANTPSARRGDATQAYRERQRVQVAAILDDLTKAGRQHGPTIVRQAYRAGGLAVDRTLGPGAAVEGRFGGVHARAVEAIAQNMTRALDAAAANVAQNVATVFARADALEGAIPVNGVGGLGFIGRRQDDLWRTHALEAVGQGLVAQDTRRQVSAHLRDRLIREGATDALTGFVTRTGARIPLDHYVSMVARTTTREAVSRGTVNRLDEGGRDLVTISSHPHKADECTPYDGRTFSLRGATPGYDVLDVLPPFHPNCLHVLTPAGADLDAWEAELSGAIREPVRQPVRPPEAATAPPRPSPGAPTPREAATAQNDLAPDEVAVLDRWRMSAHRPIVEGYNEQGIPATPEAQLFDRAARKLPTESGTVYRGINIDLRDSDGYRARKADDVLGVLRQDVGREIDWARPVSTSADDGNMEKLTLGPGARVVYRIESSRLRNVNAYGALREAWESERVILPGRYRVDRITVEEFPVRDAFASNYGGTESIAVVHMTDVTVDAPLKFAGLTDAAAPRLTAATSDRLEAQRIADLIASDPGTDAAGEWWAHLEATDRNALKAAARDRRKANAALNEALGPDLAKFIDRAWGKRERVRERLLSGELTIDDATNMAIDEWDAQDKRAEEAAIRKSLRERRAGSARARCPSCGRFKPRPSAVCQVCGDDPVPLGSDPNEFDREYGYYAADAKQRLASGYEADPFGGG